MKNTKILSLMGLCLGAMTAMPVVAALQHPFMDRSAVTLGVTFDAAGTNSLEFARRTASTNQDQVFFIGMENKLNFNVGLEHKLSHEDARLFLEYDHFSKDSSSTEDEGTLIFNSENGGGVPIRATGEISYETDNLKLGSRHRLHFCPNFRVDLGAGISWMDLDSQQTTSEGIPTALIARLVEEHEFTGIGPYFDFTTRFDPHRYWPHIKGLHLVAHGGLGLLYAKTKYRAQQFTSAGTLTQNFERETVKTVATELLGRLALGWETHFNNKTQLGILLGYQVRHYSGALAYGEWSAPGAIMAGNPIAGAGGSSTSQPFTRQGPFLEIKF